MKVRQLTQPLHEPDVFFTFSQLLPEVQSWGAQGGLSPQLFQTNTDLEQKLQSYRILVACSQNNQHQHDSYSSNGFLYVQLYHNIKLFIFFQRGYLPTFRGEKCVKLPPPTDKNLIGYCCWSSILLNLLSKYQY